MTPATSGAGVASAPATIQLIQAEPQGARCGPEIRPADPAQRPAVNNRLPLAGLADLGKQTPKTNGWQFAPRDLLPVEDNRIVVRDHADNQKLRKLAQQLAVVSRYLLRVR